jgi:hypothetical protein
MNRPRNRIVFFNVYLSNNQLAVCLFHCIK